MAELFGEMMSNWPTWAIGVVTLFVSLGVVFAYIIYSGAEIPIISRRRNGKK